MYQKRYFVWDSFGWVWLVSTKFHQHKRLEVPFPRSKRNFYFSHLTFSNTLFLLLFNFPFSNTLFLNSFFHLRQILFMNWKLESLMHPANSVETFLLQKRNWRCIVTISRYFSFLKISSLLVLCRNWKVERESPFEVWCIPPASCKFRAKFLA